MPQNVVGFALVILPMLGLACLSVAENLGESGLNFAVIYWGFIYYIYEEGIREMHKKPASP